jgi:hypothetical protein
MNTQYVLSKFKNVKMRGRNEHQALCPGTDFTGNPMDRQRYDRKKPSPIPSKVDIDF